MGRRARHAVPARPRPHRPRGAHLHRPALARRPVAAGRDAAQAHAGAADPVREDRRARGLRPADLRGRRRHQRAHGPQRRLPSGRHAGGGARPQARHRLRADDPQRAARPRVQRDPGRVPGGRGHRRSGRRLVLRRRHPPQRADQARAVTRRRAGDRRRPELDRARRGPDRRPRAPGRLRRRRPRHRRAARRPAGRGHPDADDDQPARRRAPDAQSPQGPVHLHRAAGARHDRPHRPRRLPPLLRRRSSTPTARRRSRSSAGWWPPAPTRCTASC